MAIYNHLKGKQNVEIAKMLDGLCSYCWNLYNKYKTSGFSSLVPAHKYDAPKFMTEEQEQQLKEIITQNIPHNVGFQNKKNWNASLALQ